MPRLRRAPPAIGQGSGPDSGHPAGPGGPIDLDPGQARTKAGLEFRPGRNLAARVGFSRGQSAVDAADLSPVYPDLAFNTYTFGFGYDGPVFSIFNDEEKINDLSFDIFLRYSSAARAVSTVPGFEIGYESNRLVFGVGVGLVF